MSKIGNRRVGLQESPAYVDGWRAASLGVTRDYVESSQSFYAEDDKAWQLGWDDYHAQEQTP